MNRLFLGLLTLSALGTNGLAQQDLRSRLRPITSEVKHAGTLHLGTGTWTRAGKQSAFLGGTSVVYDNTCDSGYYAAMAQGEVFSDTGGIPNISEVPAPSTAIPGAYDRNPGCADTYDITGFQIAYCTYFPGPSFSVDIGFYDLAGPAGVACPVPGVAAAMFQITGLPGSTSLNAQACWIVSFDLLAAPASNFPLTGTGGAQNQIFAWSFTQVSPSMPPPVADGAFLAGGLGSPSPTVCSGTDGTRWDTGTASVAWPLNQGEEGTGMFNLDALRIDGNTTAPQGPGCYWLGGNPRASLHLELETSSACPSCLTTCVGTAYCFGDGSTATTCPCGNFGAPGAGCNNSVGNGGATLSAIGTASLANDTVSFTQVNELGSSLSIFLQGTLDLPAGVVFGDGVRCAGGSLKRLYVRSAVGGTVNAPIVGSDPSVSAQSASLGDVIAPGQSRYYGVYYRDANAGFCPNPPGNTWNIGNSYSIVWGG